MGKVLIHLWVISPPTVVANRVCVDLVVRSPLTTSTDSIRALITANPITIASPTHTLNVECTTHNQRDRIKGM